MLINYDYKNLEVNGTPLKRNVTSTQIKVTHSKENIFFLGDFNSNQREISFSLKGKINETFRVKRKV